MAASLLQETEATPLRVLDPACGAGALLVAAGKLAGEAGRAIELVGLELDAVRAREARERLAALGPTVSFVVEQADALERDAWPASTAILANPPWASFSGRETARDEALTRHADLARGTGRWPSLHGAFLARIARHVAQEATRARVLLPASVAELEGYGPLRAEVTARAELSGPPTALEQDAFAGVSVPAIELALAPRTRPGRGSERPWWVPDPEVRELLAPLHAVPRLPPAAYSDPGVHTGNAAALLVYDEREDLPGLREGRDLSPYALAPPRRRLDVNLEPTPERRFRRGPFERYRRVPILLRQTARRPLAALHVDPTYFRNSLLACEPPPELDPAFCVAVLNSSVAGAWHRLSFAEARQRSFPQVKVSHLRTLPFPFLRRDAAPTLHDHMASLVRTRGAEAHEELDKLVFEAFGLERGLREALRKYGG